MPNSATTTTGRKPVTARCTGVASHHHDIHTSSPRLARTAYDAPPNGVNASSRNAAGAPAMWRVLRDKRGLPGFHVLVAAARAEEHDRLVAADLLRRDELLNRREAGAAFRRREQAFEPRHVAAGVHQFLVGGGDGFAVAR